MSIEEIVDKADAEIMDVVYEWARVNFDVKGWVQYSTEIRDVLKDILTEYTEGLAQLAESKKVPPQQEDWGSNVPKWETFNDGIHEAVSAIRSTITHT